MSLSDVLGESMIIRIIDFLEIHQEFDYSKAEIARYLGISKAALYTAWPTIQKAGLVKETRRIGNAVLYKFNLENPVAQTLEKMTNAADMQALEQEARRHKIAIPIRA